MINIYTDGACSKNPGPGGWGVYIDNLDEELSVDCYLHGSSEKTTNQEMELMAAVKALFAITEIARNYDYKEFAIYSDSAYLCNCINQQWYVKWQQNGWLTAKRQPVLNKQHWESILDFIQILKNQKCLVDFIKIQGHSEIHGNEVADSLARKGRDEASDKIGNFI